MSPESVLITGANRGIGLEFVRQFTLLEQPPRYIFATYRNPDSLQELIKVQDSCENCEVILLKMDVTELEEVEASKLIIEEIVGDSGLNLLINNAGIGEPLGFPRVTTDNLEKHFRVNTMGPIMVTQVMLPLLEKAAGFKSSDKMSIARSAILNLSSLTGSITNTGKVFTEDLVIPAYKISKAALNMAMRTIAAKLKNKGVLVVMMCPGWVKTGMGGKDISELSEEESIADMMRTFEKLDESHHGSFVDRFANQYSF